MPKPWTQQRSVVIPGSRWKFLKDSLQSAGFQHIGRLLGVVSSHYGMRIRPTMTLQAPFTVQYVQEKVPNLSWTPVIRPHKKGRDPPQTAPLNKNHASAHLGIYVDSDDCQVPLSHEDFAATAV